MMRVEALSEEGRQVVAVLATGKRRFQAIGRPARRTAAI